MLTRKPRYEMRVMVPVRTAAEHETSMIIVKQSSCSLIPENESSSVKMRSISLQPIKGEKMSVKFYYNVLTFSTPLPVIRVALTFY